MFSYFDLALTFMAAIFFVQAIERLKINMKDVQGKSGLFIVLAIMLFVIFI